MYCAFELNTLPPELWFVLDGMAAIWIMIHVELFGGKEVSGPFAVARLGHEHKTTIFMTTTMREGYYRNEAARSGNYRSSGRKGELILALALGPRGCHPACDKRY